MDDSIIADIIEDLGIKVENIKHFKLVGGEELIGEVISTEDCSDFVIVNPVKILRDTYITEHDMSTQHYMVDWNPCGDESPDMVLKDAHVIKASTPIADVVYNYLYYLNDVYYPNDIVFTPDDVSSMTQAVNITMIKETEDEDNVVDFFKYYNNKNA